MAILESNVSAILSAWTLVSDQQVGQQALADQFGVSPREIGSFLVLKLGLEHYKEITHHKRQWAGRKIGLSRKSSRTKQQPRRLPEETLQEIDRIRERRLQCLRSMSQFTPEELQCVQERLLSRLGTHPPPAKPAKPMFFTLDDY